MSKKIYSHVIFILFAISCESKQNTVPQNTVKQAIQQDTTMVEKLEAGINLTRQIGTTTQKSFTGSNDTNFQTIQVPNKQTDHFEAAYEELAGMMTGKQAPNLKRAVFLTENAWHNGKLSYADFCQQIDDIVAIMRKMVKEQGLEAYKTAGNWAAHTYLCKPITENDFKPYTYNFDDAFGSKDFTNTFVTQLLATKGGTCHSLPLLYKILTDEYGGQLSHLAMAPNHMYIKHKDEKGTWFNLELTNGHFSSDAWIISSSHIKAEAIQQKVYMSALTQQESIGVCMDDLVHGYVKKHGYGYNDDFLLRCLNASLKVNPVDIVAIGAKSNVLTQKLLKASKKRGIPDIKSAHKVPELQALAAEVEAIYKLTDDLGYEEMDKKAYNEWIDKMRKESTNSNQNTTK